MTQIKSTSFSTKILFVLLALAGLGAGLGYYYTSYATQGVYEYDPSIDRDFIINLFKNDWYWLISDASAKDYSVERMLDYRASSREHTGDLILRVYRVQSKPVGFLAYFPGELFVWYILFCAVDKAHRSKGYARKMMNYALEDVKKRGARVVRLITRADNLPAQKLYKSLGFKQIWTDGAYVKFEKDLSK